MESDVILLNQKKGILLAKVGCIHDRSFYVDPVVRLPVVDTIKELGDYY